MQQEHVRNIERTRLAPGLYVVATPIGNLGDLTARAIETLRTLVAFDTTSRGSNLALVEYVEATLRTLGVSPRRVPNADGTKANLLATIGPNVEGGIVLSGHTDVVPVDGQPWSTDPWVLTERDGRLYGRGTCDMKGFLAIALAAAPDFAAAPLKRPRTCRLPPTHPARTTSPVRRSAPWQGGSRDDVCLFSA